MKRNEKFEIFTDAGSFNNGKQRYPNLMQLSSSNGVLTYDRNIITGFSTVNPNTTNNYGEIFAIYLALKESIEIIKKLSLEKPYNIDLYSDSMISVKGLTKWLKNWKKNMYNGDLYTSEGKLVSNQEIIKLIDNEFLQNSDYCINIYHIRGHIDIKKPKDIKRARDTFIRENGFGVSDDKLKFIITMNNICDRYAQIVLNRGIEKYAKR